MKPILRKVTPTPQSSFSIRKDKGKNLLNNWHYHPELELLLIKNNSGTRLVGDSVEYFQPGDLVLLGPDLPHTFNHHRKNLNIKGPHSAEAIVIHFRKDFLGPHFWDLPEMAPVREIIKLSKQGLIISGKTKSNVSCYMSRMLDAGPGVRICLLLQILDEIATRKEYKLLASKGYNYSENYNDNDRISRVYHYTLENYAAKITIERVASILFLSRQSFCRYFKLKTRKTYFQFLIEVRIGHACKLLLDNELSVAEICFACGYNNISHFNHQFKMVTEKTPIQYQQNHAKNLRQIEELKLSI
ncbi:MAG TPA: AraC family transcriptional regulator [Puia sp.]|jgi:AraC-like DNA-binding protein